MSVPRLVGLFLAVTLAIGATGGASSSEDEAPPRRGCPPGDEGATYPATSYEGALAQAKRAVYGRRFSIQGHTYIASPRNTQLVAAVHVQNLSLVPGMRKLFSVMHRRCGKHTPYTAWSFTFHRFFEIVPDYWPYFVVRASNGWYVF